MNKFISLLKKDMQLAFQDIFLIMELLFAVVFMLVLVFLIPGDIRTTGKVYIYDETKLVENFIMTYYPEAEKEAGEYYVQSRTEVIEGMKKDSSAVGILISSTNSRENPQYNIQLLTQPYTMSAIIKWIAIDMEDLLSMLHPPNGIYSSQVYSANTIEALHRGKNEVPPFNKQILPPVLIFMVGMIGLFAMVSILGQERVDITIRAFRLTPTPMWIFLLSKLLIILITGAISFSILYLPLIGWQGYLPALLTITLTNLIGAAFGVLLASFYSSPLEGIGPVFVIIFVLSFPIISLLMPTFNPLWMRFIPTYYSLFALDSAIFPEYNSESIIVQSQLILAAAGLVLTLLAAAFFNHKIQREV